jgi:hypothetical protein
VAGGVACASSSSSSRGVDTDAEEKNDVTAVEFLESRGFEVDGAGRVVTPGGCQTGFVDQAWLSSIGCVFFAYVLLSLPGDVTRLVTGPCCSSIIN